MPCFKGLAVSIHTPDGPLQEYSIQKNSRQSRITSYIPVPPPKIPADSTSGKPEQSTFAVSVTLLIPNQRVPYSTPKPTPENPYPVGKQVAPFPGTLGGDRDRHGGVIGPYIPRTGSPNETLAAYIYFDGRPKEEVATLLRRGEETWVNSRWVSVPAAEGGGIAEREFLFREVGLERWLNGLDLVGKDKDKAAKIQKRHRKLRNRFEDGDEARRHSRQNSGIDGINESAMDEIKVEGDPMSSDESDDEPPEAEAAGQIKIALFRVLASGEVKKGEYEPQFNADDDDGENATGGDADIEHTTSLAKPKTLDPKTISTQTVTGLDAPDAPYATFTFLYRSEKQLRKMGILEPVESTAGAAAPKTKSTDFSKLGPLNKFGTVGFTGYREQTKPKRPAPKASDAMVDDSDAEDDDDKPRNDANDDDDAVVNGRDGQIDGGKQGELSEGVRKIKLKRTHSTEGLSESRKSPHTAGSDSPPAGEKTVAPVGSLPKSLTSEKSPFDSASPFKKQRPSMDGIEGITLPPSVTNGAVKPATSSSATIPEVSIAEPAGIPLPGPAQGADDDEEL